MNVLYNLNKSLHCGLQKQIRSFWSARNLFVCCKRDLSDASVNIKPIVFRAIGVPRSCIFNRKFFGFTPIVRTYEKSVFDVETNVKKDVLLYENKTSFFYILNYLIPVQLVGWLLMSYHFLQVVSAIPSEHLTVFQLLDLNKPLWKYGVPSAFALTGVVITLGAIIFSRRYVSKIILHKGGKSVYIETFGILGTDKKDFVNLDKLSCRVSRHATKGYLPLQRLDRKNFVVNYVVDNTGHFPDPFLFDMTAGMQRELKNL